MMVQMLVGAGGSLLTATMTEGSGGGGSTGYIEGSFGSMSSNLVLGLGTLKAAYDVSPNNSYISISGDISQSAFTSVTIGSTTQTSASATRSYSSISNSTTWNWSTTFGIDGTGTSIVLIV